MILSFIFIIPYIVNGIMNYRYKLLTISLIFVMSFISIFIMKYIEPLNYLIVLELIASPVVINNFEYNKEKNF